MTAHPRSTLSYPILLDRQMGLTHRVRLRRADVPQTSSPSPRAIGGITTAAVVMALVLLSVALWRRRHLRQRKSLTTAPAKFRVYPGGNLSVEQLRQRSDDLEYGAPLKSVRGGPIPSQLPQKASSPTRRAVNSPGSETQQPDGSGIPFHDFRQKLLPPVPAASIMRTRSNPELASGEAMASPLASALRHNTIRARRGRHHPRPVSTRHFSLLDDVPENDCSRDTSHKSSRPAHQSVQKLRVRSLNQQAVEMLARQKRRTTNQTASKQRPISCQTILVSDQPGAAPEGPAPQPPMDSRTLQELARQRRATASRLSDSASGSSLESGGSSILNEGMAHARPVPQSRRKPSRRMSALRSSRTSDRLSICEDKINEANATPHGLSSPSRRKTRSLVIRKSGHASTLTQLSRRSTGGPKIQTGGRVSLRGDDTARRRASGEPETSDPRFDSVLSFGNVPVAPPPTPQVLRKALPGTVRIDSSTRIMDQRTPARSSSALKIISGNTGDPFRVQEPPNKPSDVAGAPINPFPRERSMYVPPRKPVKALRSQGGHSAVQKRQDSVRFSAHSPTVFPPPSCSPMSEATEGSPAKARTPSTPERRVPRGARPLPQPPSATASAHRTSHTPCATPETPLDRASLALSDDYDSSDGRSLFDEGLYAEQHGAVQRDSLLSTSSNDLADSPSRRFSPWRKTAKAPSKSLQDRASTDASYRRISALAGIRKSPLKGPREAPPIPRMKPYQFSQQPPRLQALSTIRGPRTPPFKRHPAQESARTAPLRPQMEQGPFDEAESPPSPANPHGERDSFGLALDIGLGLGSWELDLLQPTDFAAPYIDVQTPTAYTPLPPVRHAGARPEVAMRVLAERDSSFVAWPRPLAPRGPRGGDPQPQA